MGKPKSKVYAAGQRKKLKPRGRPIDRKYCWQAGQSGNPAGQVTAGAKTRQWLNLMADWPLDKLRKVMRDKDAPAAARWAARTAIDAASEDRSSSGMPIAGPDYDRVVHDTDGKPVARSVVSVASAQHERAWELAEKIKGNAKAALAVEEIARLMDPEIFAGSDDGDDTNSGSETAGEAGDGSAS